MSSRTRKVLAGLLVFALGCVIWRMTVATREQPSQNVPVDALEFRGVTADRGRSTNLVAAGEWSAPVTDDAGYTLRGRLLIFDTPHQVVTDQATGRFVREWWGNAPVYLELQNLSAREDEPLAVYFDLQDGLDCEVTDANGRSAPLAPVRWDLDTPRLLQNWMLIPLGGSVRLRADLRFGGDSPRPNAVLQFGNFKRWLIPVGNTNSHYLKGNFSAPTNRPSPTGAHVWSGTIALPRVAINLPSP